MATSTKIKQDLNLAESCQHCAAFRRDALRHQRNKRLIGSIMAGGIAAPAAMLLGNAIITGSGLVAFWGGVILLSCFTVLMLSINKNAS